MRNWHFSSFYFFYFITLGILVPYWSLHLQDLGFDATQIGQLMGIFLLTKMVAPNIWAALADRVAHEKGHSFGLLKFAAIATLALYCLMFWATSFWTVAAVMFSYCLFWNACLPQLEAATLNHLKGRSSSNIAHTSSSYGSSIHYGSIRLWGSIGFIVSVFGIGVLMDFYGPSVILPAGALGLSSIVLVSLCMQTAKSNVQHQSSTTTDSMPSISRLLNIRIIMLLLLCVAMQMSHAPFYTFFSIYLESYQYSKTYIGALWSVGVIFEIGVFLIAYRLLRHYRLAHLLTFTFAIASIRWFLVAKFPENGALIFFSQMLHALTYGLYHSVMIQFIDRLFQGSYQIRGQALYSSVSFGAGGAAGSILSGYVWSSYGGSFLFQSAAWLMLVVTIVSFLITPLITRASTTEAVKST